MNPATAFAVAVADELVRCGLTDVVIAPGSRSAPLAMEFWRRAQRGGANPAPGGAGPGKPRLHVRIDERSAAFLALGIAKASRRPVAVVCTSGTAAAHFHAAVVEADESAVPLIILTADRPPELRGTGANQTIDQIKLYGGAVRWFCEAGVPEARPGMNAYWRSLACRAWAAASGAAGGLAGPAHVNVPLREPLVPDRADPAWADPAWADPAWADPAWRGDASLERGALAEPVRPGPPGTGSMPRAGLAGAVGGAARPGADAREGAWPEPLEGRPGGQPWTGFRPAGAAAGLGGWHGEDALAVPWAERGIVVCGDGDYDAAPLLRLAERAGWPVLAEPSSGARRGPNALATYPLLLTTAEFAAAHRPELIITAGRPTLSRGQLAYLRSASPSGRRPRHVVITQGPGRWADPARSATDVAAAVRLAEPEEPAAAGGAGGPRVAASPWLRSWLAADAAARRAADQILNGSDTLTEPRLARDLSAALLGGTLLWAASSLPIRDLDCHMPARDGIRVLANRGASGIDGLVSSAIGAALAHQAAGGGPAAALLGDLAFLHDAPGLFLGPEETRPDLLIVVVSNDGGGVFSTLEQAEFPGAFERVFGTPHGVSPAELAAAAGVPAALVSRPDDLPAALAGSGLRVAEVRADRAEGAALRRRIQQACAAAIR